MSLAGRGASIVLHYGSAIEAARGAQDQIEALGVEALPHRANLADPDDITRLFDAIHRRFSRLDVLVNSAASFQKQSFASISAADWDQVMAVNLRAPFLCSQHAARLMRLSAARRNAPGLIVNIGDLSGVHAWTGFAHHAASKAGLIHLTKVAARELAPEIRVNAVIPGPILPPPGVDVDDEAWQETGGRVPLGHPGAPEDIGQAVVYLAENDYLTGVLLPVDGGESLLGPGH
jgi:NAD(P)-dependent dehydrogenase (short-subunit alcohol dehydrogenase family)